MKKQVKNRSNIKEKQVSKDYSKGESSPYNEYLDKKGDYNQEHDASEPTEANPDRLSEDQGLYYKREMDDNRLDIIRAVMSSLTDKQREILRLCGNEGRTIENCAAILKISRGTVQKTLDRIRKKVSDLQKDSF